MWCIGTRQWNISLAGSPGGAPRDSTDSGSKRIEQSRIIVVMLQPGNVKELGVHLWVGGSSQRF